MTARPANIVWTEDELAKVAKKFKTRRRFFEGNPGAYRACLRRGIMNKVCSHMELKRPGRPRSKPLSKKAVREGAKDFTLMRALIKERPDIHRSAVHHDMVDELKGILQANRGG